MMRLAMSVVAIAPSRFEAEWLKLFAHRYDGSPSCLTGGPHLLEYSCGCLAPPLALRGIKSRWSLLDLSGPEPLLLTATPGAGSVSICTSMGTAK